MAGGLSDEEFQRLQTQLLELRTSNYQLQEQCRRQDRELVNLRSTSASLEKELQKEKSKPSFMQNIGQNIGKGKKKELEGLQAENEALQHRLGSQEEEFRLQNQTLMDELTKVVAASEDLEKKNAELSKRLAGEGAVLTAARSSRMNTLTSANAELETRCVKLSGQRGVPAGGAEESERTVEGSPSQEEKAEEEWSLESELSRLLDRELTKFLSEVQSPGESDPSSDAVLQEKLASLREQLIPEIKSSVTRAGPVIDGVYVHSSGSSVVDLLRQTEEKCSQLEKQVEEMSDLQIKVDTEREEKTILKEQIQSLEVILDQNSRLQEDLTAAQRRLQEVEERGAQQVKERDLQLQELTAELSTRSTESKQHVHNVTTENENLRSSLAAMEQQLNSSLTSDLQAMQNCPLLSPFLLPPSTRQTERLNSSLTGDLQSMQTAHNQLVQERDDLRCQLQEGQAANSRLLEQLQQTAEERDQQMQALNEANRTLYHIKPAFPAHSFASRPIMADVLTEAEHGGWTEPADGKPCLTLVDGAAREIGRVETTAICLRNRERCAVIAFLSTTSASLPITLAQAVNSSSLQADSVQDHTGTATTQPKEHSVWLVPPGKHWTN
ncbi:regulation of modification of synaptic structure [Branchiostoma belcheri]|nr:regulation of modification of synaptic structure [Branchiostoma belcheri]